MEAPLVRCDQCRNGRSLGISLAGFNAIFSLAGGGVRPDLAAPPEHAGMTDGPAKTDPDRVDAPRRSGGRIWRDAHLCRPARGDGRPPSDGAQDRAYGRAGATPSPLLRRYGRAARGPPDGAAAVMECRRLCARRGDGGDRARAAMACTAAVETEIDRHYRDQLDELADSDPELGDAVADFRAEELEHQAAALAAGAEQAPGYPLLSLAIRTGCRAAIALSKRI